MSGRSTAPSDMPLRRSRSGEGTVFPKPEEGRRLISAFVQIEDAKVRLGLIKLAEALVRARAT
jgi:hypothetical protein